MKPIKERTFYALEVCDNEGSSLIGIWDNPSLAERELRRIFAEFKPLFEYAEEIKGEGGLTFKLSKPNDVIMNCAVEKLLNMRPIKLNIRLP